MGQSALRRIRYAPSPADPYFDAGSGFVHPKILSGEAVWGSAAYPRRFQVADHDHFQDAIGEHQPAGIKFQTELIGFGGSPPGAGNAVVAGDGESGGLFKSCFGNQTKDTGGLVGVGSTTTSIVLQAGEGAGFSIGNLVGFFLANAFHVRQIRNKATDTLTIAPALPSAPITGDTAYASSSFFKAVDGHQHMWFDFEGFDVNAVFNFRRTIRGCLGNFQIRGGGLAVVDWDFMGVDWALTTQGTTMGPPTYPVNMPAAGVGTNRSCRLFMDGSDQKIAEFEYSLGNDIKPQLATNTANGVAKFRIVDSGQTLRFRVLWEEGSVFVTKLTTSAIMDLLIEVTGGGAGNSFGLAAPRAQVVDTTLTSQDGLDYLDVNCKLLRADSLTPALPAVVFGML